jgi:hypothetical protein
VYLEEFARTQIAAEEMHSLELRKMMRDIGVGAEHGHGHHEHEESGKKRKGAKKRKR